MILESGTKRFKVNPCCFLMICKDLESSGVRARAWSLLRLHSQFPT